MVWFNGGMWHFGGKSRMRMGFPWSKHQETLRWPPSHIKFRCLVGQGFTDRGGGGGHKTLMGPKKPFSPRFVSPPPTTSLICFLSSFFFSHLLSSFFLCTFRFVGDWTIHSPHQNFWRTNLEETTLRSRFQRRFLWTFRCVSHLVTIAACRQTRTGKRNRRERGRWYLPPKPRTKKQEEREQHTYGP